MKTRSIKVLENAELAHRVADCLERLGVKDDGYHLKNFEILYSKSTGVYGEHISDRQKRRIVSKVLRGKANKKYEKYVFMLEKYTDAMERIWKTSNK
jgi:hypothetical protein